LPGCIDIAFISLAFTYVGFRTKDFWMSYHSAKLVFVAVAVFALSVTLNYKLSGNVQVGFFSGEFGFFSLFFLTALSGIFLTVSLSYRIGYHKILSYLGKNSLTIYVLHYIPLGILWIVTNKVCSTSNQSNLQALAIGIILTMVVCTIMVPIVEFVNKHMAWTIGKKRN
jgi:fucose 4-O-acetylase-like acetyltransferase